MIKHYNLAIIGAGPGGHAAAEHAAKLGAKVAIIEKYQWGGTCTHVGCIPTKALLACSKAFSHLKKLKRMGITVGDAQFDFSAMKRHQAQVVRTSALGVRNSLEKLGVDLIEGEGHLLEKGKILVNKKEGQETITADHIIIAWGSEPVVFPNIQISQRVLTSTGLLALETLPKDLIIIGGGIIGTEFATCMAELGVNVTMIELGSQILPSEDEEVGAFIEKEIKALGVSVLTHTKMEDLKESETGVELNITDALGEHRTLQTEYILIAVGRKPTLYTQELDALGIAYDRRGIKIDKNMHTNVSGIYAIGDVTGGALLAHRASHQAKALVDHLFGKGEFIYKDENVPFVTYSHPSVARVGLTEKEAKTTYPDLEVLRFEYGANAMARAELAANGFIKALYHQNKLLGVTIVGKEAHELIAPIGLSIAHDLTKKDFKKWILAHPTLSEILNVLTD
ncbi:MAG: dihydrolipoyl dehydrogenase [Gammaproteobacteria bacterium]|nr:dihydrolipoyl dehydrogenase [Gammaproteobacteria bacterium]